jgi:predicted small lipoprotein YifL
MKKLFALLLVLATVSMVLVACVQNGDSQQSDGNGSDT